MANHFHHVVYFTYFSVAFDKNILHEKNIFQKDLIKYIACAIATVPCYITVYDKKNSIACISIG